MSHLVLIDRDGTINVEKHYLSSPDQIKLLAGTSEGIKLLREIDCNIAVITNQSAIGRGFFNLDKLEDIHQRLNKILENEDTKVDAIYFCPHLPEDECDCRKPAINMAEKAASKFNADLSDSFVIGDNVCDIELGKNINATTFLVRTGYGKTVEKEKKVKPDYIVDNLLEAAKIIKQIIKKDRVNAR